jgi:hypothetical protein
MTRIITKICGIDPGFHVAAPGGIAFVAKGIDGLVLSAAPMPLMALPGAHNQHTRHLRQCDLYAVTLILQAELPDHVVIESQGARPKQHAGHSFKAAVHFGTLIGVCCALDLPYELVMPNIWKADLELIHASKAACMAKATALMPALASRWTRHKDHGVAEAALIAWWRLHHGPKPSGKAQ